jgi:hypothetical protein
MSVSQSQDNKINSDRSSDRHDLVLEKAQFSKYKALILEDSKDKE